MTGVLDMEIDNGNHLVLSATKPSGRYLSAIGAEDRVVGRPGQSFPFLSMSPRATPGTLRPNDGPIPWWALVAGRRVPGTRLGD